MKWFIGILILTLSIELMAQTTAISVIENPVVSNLSEVQELINARGAVVDYQFVNVDLNSLQNETSIRISFFDVDMIISRDRLEQRNVESFSWFGHDATKTATFVISVSKTDVQGRFSSFNADYRIETILGMIVIEKIDQSKYPSEDCGNYLDQNDPQNKNDEGYNNSVEGDLPDELELPPHQCKLRVLVLYTPAAASASGTNMNNLAQLAIDEMNQSFANSGIYREAELVFVQQVEYTETASMTDDLTFFRDNNDGYMDVVHNYRVQYAADVCVLLVEDPQYCGLAAALRSSSKNAFAIVAWDCATGNYSFAHEIAHLYGCQHHQNDPVDLSLSNYAPYAHGFKAPSSTWRTIMAYDCSSGCARIMYWSNPAVMYNGQPMGVPGTNNNAKMIEDNSERMMFLSPNNQNIVVTNNDVNVSWAKTIYSGGTMNTSSNVVIQWGRNYRFRAEISVEMTAGFEAAGGSEFEAIVLPCGEKGEGPIDFSALPDASNKTNVNPQVNNMQWGNTVLYPNPVNNTVIISGLPSGITEFNIQIFSTKGRLLLQLTNQSSFNHKLSSPVNVDALNPGLYFLRIITRKGDEANFKFIKN